MADRRPKTETEDPRVTAALAEYLQLVDRGEGVPVAEFLARHADIAGELRSLLVTSEGLAQLQPDRAAPETSTRSMAEQNVETIAPQRVQTAASETVLQRLPDTFGRYRIIKPLGSGAMGDVYLAEDTQLHRQVAIKTPSFDADETGELLERFYREARSAAVVRHSNICPVFDVGEINGRHYISMAYIEGQPLSAYIRPDKLQPERQALVVIRKLALALQEAHDHGIIHRDLKPGNVMIDRKGEPIVMDFGLARPVQSEAGARLTQSGMLVGSPAYMSPEQVEGDTSVLMPATDQYSLGVILYELLTGGLPFRGGITAIIASILTKAPKPPGELRAGLDPRIESLCLKMMAKSPRDRFPSMRAVGDAIAAILKSDPERPSEKTKSAATPPVAASRAEPKPQRPQPVAPAAAAASITASNVEALYEAAAKCMRKHDYEQVVQMLDGIPEHKRSDQVRALLKKARELSDEVAFLLAEVDEAMRLNDNEALGKHADALLKLKPRHHKAMQIKEELSRYGGGRIWKAGGWTPDGRRIGEESGLTRILLLAGAVFGLTLLSVILYLRVGDAVVRVQINHPDIEVGIQDRTLNIKSANQDLKVEPGEDTLKVSFQGAEFETDKFTLNKGENPAIVVELLDRTLSAKFGDLSIGEWPVETEPDAPAVADISPIEASPPDATTTAVPASAIATSSTDTSDGWTDLLNGRDLTGWRSVGDAGGWSVQNGELVADVGTQGGNVGWLMTERDYSDFELNLEFAVSELTDSGVAFRCDPNQTGFQAIGQAEIQIVDELDPAKLDRLNKLTGARSGGLAGLHADQTLPPLERGTWHTMHIQAQGRKLRVKVDDVTTVDTDLDRHEQRAREGNGRSGVWRPAGPIGLQKMLGRVRFRNIRIRELSMPASSSVAGWTDLFNGRDLTGWRVSNLGGDPPPNSWATDAAREVLIARAVGHSWLETTENYQDFDLTLEWRFTPGGSVGVNGSGIVVRTETANGDARAIEIDLIKTSDPSKPRATGGIDTINTSVQHRNGTTPDRGTVNIGPIAVPEFFDDGRWNTCEITCEGDRIRATMNGILANEVWGVPQRAGKICLRDQNTDIEFRNIRIRATEGSNAKERSTTVATLQGSWTAVGQEISGGAWTNEEIQKHEKSITFTDDRFEIRYLDRMGKLQIESGTYRLDPTNEPAHIDMKGTTRDGRAIEFVGILQMDGDELRHCFVKTSDNAAAARPTSFSTSSGQFSTTYRREGADAAAAANGAGGDWITLFNGRDLTGWTPVASDGGWSVENGVLSAVPGDGWLATDRDFGDFELELEYKLAADANSGVFLRAPITGASSGAGMLEVQLLDETATTFRNLADDNRTGALFGVFPASPRADAPPKVWNRLSVRVEGTHITSTVNGVRISDGDLSNAPASALKPDMQLPRGRIGLQRRRQPVEFRNIRIRDLSAAVAASTDVFDGKYQVLFNKDQGWLYTYRIDADKFVRETIEILGSGNGPQPLTEGRGMLEQLEGGKVRLVYEPGTWNGSPPTEVWTPKGDGTYSSEYWHPAENYAAKKPPNLTGAVSLQTEAATAVQTTVQLPRNEWIDLDPSAETATSWNHGAPIHNQQNKVWANEILTLDNAAVAYNHVQARDVSIKARVKMIEGQNIALVVRSQHGVGGIYAYIDRVDKERVRVAFLNTKHERTLKVEDEFEYEVTAVGNHATIKIDDRTVLEDPNVRIMRSGHVETNAYKARGTFRKLQVKILDN